MDIERKMLNEFRLLVILANTLELMGSEVVKTCNAWYGQTAKDCVQTKKQSFKRLLTHIDAAQKYLNEVTDGMRINFTDDNIQSNDAIMENKNALLRVVMHWCNCVYDNYDQMALERFMSDMTRKDNILIPDETIKKYTPVMSYNEKKE